MEAYREDLYAGMAYGMLDMRDFAGEWLEELLRVGYYGMEESLGLPLKQRSEDFFSPPQSLPITARRIPRGWGTSDRSFGSVSMARAHRSAAIGRSPSPMSLCVPMRRYLPR